MSRRLQNDLIELGYGDIVGKLDGIIGQKTRKAVRQLQMDHKLKVDGITGKQTNAKIEELKENAGKNGTRNFNINEFRSPDNDSLPKDGMDSSLLLKLERLRWYVGNRPVIINSGYRTKAYNKKVGGIEKSNHLTGKAADIRVIGVDADKVHSLALDIFEGVGKYRNFTHVDTDEKRVRYIGKY